MPRVYASHQVSAKDGNLYSQIVLIPCLTFALAKLYGYFCTIFSNIMASCVMIYRGVKKVISCRPNNMTPHSTSSWVGNCKSTVSSQLKSLLMKERPWSMHLRCSPKRRVGILRIHLCIWFALHIVSWKMPEWSPKHISYTLPHGFCQ